MIDVKPWRRWTHALIHRLTHNLRMLQREVDERSRWPVIKANAYGHGLSIVARHLVSLGYRTLAVADVGEAVTLADVRIAATAVVLSATLPSTPRRWWPIAASR